LAGIAADLHFSEEQSPDAYQADMEWAYTLLVVLRLPPLETESLVGDVARRAVSLVYENEAPIQAVADELRRRRELTARQVRTIIAITDAAAPGS
jgi:hypothetical protein